ncbi:MAG TPA: transglutaminase domain-containing protein [Gemmataceae bacterium]|nr:transglutaminase domain-containing protein [Gemmataceae bacterium]
MPPPRSRLALNALEVRDLPSVMWTLPGAGSYRLDVQGSELVLQRADGEVLARAPAAGAAVTVRGTAADETVAVDLRGAGAAAQLVLDGGGGYDRIDLCDSRQSDEFTFTPAGGELRLGTGATESFTGFEQVVYTGDGGGPADRDVVRLTGGPTGSSYRAAARSGLFLDAENAFVVRLNRPDEVHLTGTGDGRDILSGDGRDYALETDGFRSVARLRFAYRLARPDALYWMKRVAVRLDPGLAHAPDRMSLVLRLRDFVHHRVRQGANTAAWPARDEYQRFVQAIVSREEAVMCQGAAWLYRDLLNAFGIEAREVSLFSRTYWENHASVEVRLDGRWVVMDPTFNVAFTDDTGRLLSFAELAKRRRWTVRDDGLAARDRWVINERKPYVDYLYRIEYPPLRPE